MLDQRAVRSFAENMCAVNRVFTQLAAASREWAHSVSPAFLSLAEELEPMLLAYERQRLVEALARVRDSRP